MIIGDCVAIANLVVKVGLWCKGRHDKNSAGLVVLSRTLARLGALTKYDLVAYKKSNIISSDSGLGVSLCHLKEDVEVLNEVVSKFEKDVKGFLKHIKKIAAGSRNWEELDKTISRTVADLTLAVVIRIGTRDTDEYLPLEKQIENDKVIEHIFGEEEKRIDTVINLLKFLEQFLIAKKNEIETKLPKPSPSNLASKKYKKNDKGKTSTPGSASSSSNSSSSTSNFSSSGSENTSTPHKLKKDLAAINEGLKNCRSALKDFEKIKPEKPKSSTIEQNNVDEGALTSVEDLRRKQESYAFKFEELKHENHAINSKDLYQFTDAVFNHGIRRKYVHFGLNLFNLSQSKYVSCKDTVVFTYQKSEFKLTDKKSHATSFNFELSSDETFELIRWYKNSLGTAYAQRVCYESDELQPLSKWYVNQVASFKIQYTNKKANLTNFDTNRNKEQSDSSDGISEQVKEQMIAKEKTKQLISDAFSFFCDFARQFAIPILEIGVNA